MEEIWKDIEGYENLYQISNLGNVKSKQRYVYKSNGKIYINALLKEKILKKNIRQGYYAVKLYKNNKKVNFPVHRLVAKAFISNLEDKPCVNHKDGNKLNNNVKNLEWCTYSENILHAYKNGLSSTSEKAKENCRKIYKLGNEKTKKKVVQYDLYGNFVREWDSINEANRYFGKNKSRISAVCKNKCKQSMGYIWRYA